MKHRAFVYDRGGSVLLGELTDVTSLEWNRKRDETSTASLNIQRPSRTCRGLLEQIHPVRHEIVLFREGKRCWEGPTTLVKDAGTFEVGADDISFFLSRTVIKNKYAPARDAKKKVIPRISLELYEELLRKELEAWELAGANILDGLKTYFNSESAKTTRTIAKYESDVYALLDQTAHTGGIDYTVLNRDLLLWDTHMAMGQFPRTMTDDDFIGDIEVSKYGRELAVWYWVRDGKGNARHYRNVEDTYYGPVELLNDAYGLDPEKPEDLDVSLTELAAQAKRNMKGRYPVPEVLRIPENSTLDPCKVEEFLPYLIPGCHFNAYTSRTLTPLQQMVRLDNVTFREDERGETVNVTFSTVPGELIIV